MRDSCVLRYAAFTDRPSGGNPAGVVLCEHALPDEEMQGIAARIGYSETAFLRARMAPAAGDGEYDVRYFSPAAEVPFCGHATIASAVAIAERGRPGSLKFHTRAGVVAVRTSLESDGTTRATLTSVAPSVDHLAETDLAVALDGLRWSASDLDPELPPRIAAAGARHLVLAARTRQRLARLDYDFSTLAEFSRAHDLATIALVWRESQMVFVARNPFPFGGVVEDPATGAAAAALGAYLRHLHLVPATATLTIRQGEDMGRPSLITVGLREGLPGVEVTGSAVAIPAAMLMS